MEFRRLLPPHTVPSRPTNRPDGIASVRTCSTTRLLAILPLCFARSLDYNELTNRVVFSRKPFRGSARVVERHDPNSRVRERTSVSYSRKVGPHESANVPFDRVSFSELPGSGSRSGPGSGPSDDARRGIGQHRRRSVHILLRLLPSQPADSVHEALADGHDQPGRDQSPVLCTNPESVTLQPDLALCRRL